MSVMDIVIYLRASDPTQTDSVERQREEIHAEARRQGWRIVREFADEGISAWKDITRPEFEKMLRYIRSGEARRAGVQKLVVWKLSRIYRRMGPCLTVLDELENRWGIDVHTTKESLPTDRASRKIMRAILAAMAESYSDALSEEVASGMRYKARQGFWVYGHAPYGYLVQHDAEEGPGRLVIDPERASIIRRVFDMRLNDNDGVRKIAERLTSLAVPPPSREDMPRESGHGQWRPKHVRLILENPAYVGDVTYTASTHERDDSGRLRKVKSAREVICTNAHEPIISRESFAAANAAIAAATRNGTTRNHLRVSERSLLRPWVRCGLCGGPTQIAHGGRPPRRWYYYTCSRRAENRHSCRGIRVRVDELDPLVEADIEARVLSPEGVRALIAATVERVRATPEGERDERRARLMRSDQDLSDKIRRVVRLAEATDEKMNEVEERLAELRRQREAVRKEIAELPPVSRAPELVELDAGLFRSRLLHLWRWGDVPRRRKALALMLDSIILDADGTITINYRAGLAAGQREKADEGAEGGEADDDAISVMPHQLPFGPP